MGGSPKSSNRVRRFASAQRASLPSGHSCRPSLSPNSFQPWINLRSEVRGCANSVIRYCFPERFLNLQSLTKKPYTHTAYGHHQNYGVDDCSFHRSRCLVIRLLLWALVFGDLSSRGSKNSSPDPLFPSKSILILVSRRYCTFGQRWARRSPRPKNH